LNVVNDRVWNNFKLLLENPSLIEKLYQPLKNTEYRLKELRDRQAKIQREIEKLEEKKGRLLDLYLDSRFSKLELDEKSESISKSISFYNNEYYMASAGIKALEEQPNDLTEIIKYLKVLHCSDKKLTYDQKVRIFRQFVHKVRFNENLDFEMELYKSPIGDMPEHFRAFPRDLYSSPVQTSILNSLGDVLGQNPLGAGQVTYSPSHLNDFIVGPG
jgi:hypothetical protein